MKYKIICLCVFCIIAVKSSAQVLSISNQTIVAEQQYLTLESIEFKPLEIITNNIVTWENITLITTNGMFENYTVETNIVQQQINTPTIKTNNAIWVCNIVFELPKGYVWKLNNVPVTIERFKTRLQILVNPDIVTSTFGDAAIGLEYAASNGAYTPTGQIRDGFLLFSANIISGD